MSCYSKNKYAMVIPSANTPILLDTHHHVVFSQQSCPLGVGEEVNQGECPGPGTLGGSVDSAVQASRAPPLCVATVCWQLHTPATYHSPRPPAPTPCSTCLCLPSPIAPAPHTPRVGSVSQQEERVKQVLWLRTQLQFERFIQILTVLQTY